MKQTPAEFDAFAPGYNAGMDDMVKRFTGQTAEIFLEHKAAWLKRYFARHALPLTGLPRLLEFGCGTGGFLRALQSVEFPARMEGGDVSEGMIEEARRSWPPGVSVPPLHQFPPGRLVFDDGAFELITAVCVYHHIPPQEWVATTRELLRILKPGGRLLIFEHNPWNPVTKSIVKRCPIDRNAVLLSPLHCREMVADVFGCPASLDFILFLPPRFRRLWTLERYLAKVPLGGQYVVVGAKPPDS